MAFELQGDWNRNLFFVFFFQLLLSSPLLLLLILLLLLRFFPFSFLCLSFRLLLFLLLFFFGLLSLLKCVRVAWHWLVYFSRIRTFLSLQSVLISSLNKKENIFKLPGVILQQRFLSFHCIASIWFNRNLGKTLKEGQRERERGRERGTVGETENQRNRERERERETERRKEWINRLWRDSWHWIGKTEGRLEMR